MTANINFHAVKKIILCNIERGNFGAHDYYNRQMTIYYVNGAISTIEFFAEGAENLEIKG